jgi:hypothetical protein
LLDKLKAQGSAEGGGGALERIELDLVVLRVQQAIQLGAARVHALGHFTLGQALGFHRLGDLPREDALDRMGVGGVAESFVLQDTGERRSNVRVHLRSLASRAWNRSFAKREEQYPVRYIGQGYSPEKNYLHHQRSDSPTARPPVRTGTLGR